MTTFVQLHLLTFVPPANLNRDDTGAPKTAIVGGDTRLRLSSQSLKRAWRTSDVFAKRVGGRGALGVRTARIGEIARKGLIDRGIETASALAIAKTLSAIFGKPDTKPRDGEERALTSQLAFVAPDEIVALEMMLDNLAADASFRSELSSVAGEIEDEDGLEGGGTKKKKKGLPKKRLNELRSRVLVTSATAVDIAMFGRMFADSPLFNREAAVQVAHALTTHRVEIEDDFYTAVDDLNTRDENVGAGFVGEAGFGSGVFYLYLCIDTDLLTANLGGDADLAKAAIAALVEAAATVAPNGKQASFASRVRASYVLAEKGTDQPRTLAAAFVPSVKPGNALVDSIAALTKLRAGFAAAYGAGDTTAIEMNVADPDTKSLADIVAFACDLGA